MANISGASLEGIQERLLGIPNYHPLDANTFSDWSVEAGDIVKVMRGSTEYESPIHSTRLVWKGAPEMVISSTGNKERDPVAKVSRKKYGRGGAAVRSEEKLYREFTSSDGLLWSAIYMSESMLYTHFDNAISDVHSMILETADQIYSTVYASDSQLYSYVDQTATYIQQGVASTASSLGSTITQTAASIRSEVHAADSQLYSYVNQTATSIQQSVASTVSGLQSSITETADKVNIIVEGTGTNVHIKPAQIQAGIDAATGSSKINLSANHIILDGDAVASSLETKNLTVQYFTADNGMTVNGSILATSLEVSGNIYNGDFPYNIYDASVSPDGTTLTLHRFIGEDINFRKAASIEALTGSWGGIRLLVTTDPSSDKSYTVGFPVTGDVYDQNMYVGWYNASSSSADGVNITVPYKVTASGENTSGQIVKIGNITVEGVLDNTYATAATAITANGTYEPAEGKVGFNKIIVDVQGAAIDYRLLPTWDANQHNKLTITRTENQDYGTSYTLYVVGALDDLEYNATSHKYHTTAYAKAGTSMSSLSVRNTTDTKYSGLEAFNDGYDDAKGKISLPSAASSGEQTAFTMKIPNTARNGQDTLSFSMAKGTPASSGYASVSLAGVGVIGRISIGDWYDAGVTYGRANPTVSDWQLNYQANTNYTYKVKVKVNGEWQESGNLSAANAYDNGWSGCAATVGISPSSAQTLNPGGSVTVYAQAKASSGAQSKTNYASVKISAAAISTSDWSLAYQSGTNNTYKASVKVNGATYTSGNLYATDAYTNGQNAAGVSGVWDGNELTVSRLVSSSTKSLTYTVTAGASIAYNSSTHKYTATGTASAGGAQRQSKTATSGTEAYDAGYQVTDISVSYTGTSSGSKRYTKTSGSGSSANCSMQVILSCHGYSETNTWTAPVTYAYRDGYNAGYDAGSSTSPSVSFGSLGQFSTKQTSGITRNYSASAGYKYFVVPITVNGTTYKAQIYHMTS